MRVLHSPAVLRFKFVLILSFFSIFSFAQPKIISFSPVSGPAGTILTITGTGFNTSAANNLVYIGGVKATVTSATGTSLNMVVPFGATTSSITAINQGTGLSGVSNMAFKITIAGGYTLDNSSFNGHSNLMGSGYLDQGAEAISSADLDGDGKSELILQKNGSIQIYRNLSSGQNVSFSNPINYYYGGLWGKIVTGDVNADGKLDLIFARYSEIYVLLNASSPGNFQFNEAGSFSLPSGSGQIVFADLDNNGLLDILSSNTSSNSFSFLRNTSVAGNVSFAAAQSIATDIEPIGISVADLNADGKNDVVVTNSTSATISIFRNTTISPGTISFAAKLDLAISSYSKFNLLTDIDGDNKLDILVSGTGTFAAFRNTSTVSTAITMAARQDIIQGNSFTGGDMVPGDFDGDGKIDVVLAGAGSGGANNTADIRVMRNTSTVGTLAFGSSYSYRVCSSNYFNGVYYGCTYINSLVTVDLDNDGKPDIANCQDNYATFSRNIINEPTVSNFSPASGTTGTNISIAGSKFTGATMVKFGDVPATGFVVNSANSITATVAGGASGKISVTTANGTGQSAGTFTYYALPTITSFSPSNAGTGTTVTINGSNFSAISSVKFGGIEKTSMNVLSNTQMTAVVGAGASGDVTVTNPAGTASLPGFTFFPTPTISSFSPSTAGTGNAVTIIGSNFSGATAVKFGNVNASSFTVNSATSITAVVAPSSTSGNVSVTTPGGTASLAGFTFIPQPSITSFTPIRTGQGATVTITGTNFSNASAVSFGAIVATSFSVVNSTSITAVVGTGASGDVKVTTPGGTAVRPGFNFLLPPIISSFTPTVACTGNTVKIKGQNLLYTSSVQIGSFNASSFTVLNDSTIDAVLFSANNDSIKVFTPAGMAFATGFLRIYLPSISSFLPSSAGTGASITITGNNFVNVSGVKFGGIDAASFTVLNQNSISAVVGAGNNGYITITNPCGSNNSPSAFTYIQAPVINVINPTSAGTGQSVAIGGLNFTGATAVSFGGMPAQSFTVNSSTNITALVGAGASGNVSVTTPGGVATLSGFNFIPAPTITSFIPTSAAGGAIVTITGTNFTGATAVGFGGQLTSFTVVNSTTITATVWTGGASGNVTVTTPGGTASKAGFTFIPAPTISAFTPTSAQQGNTVSIAGTNFTGTTAVSFGGVAATSFVVNSPTSIAAVLGNGASGNVMVTTAGGIATKSGFTYVLPTPSITSFTPTSGGNGSTITISGNNFINVSAVSFGGVAASSYIVNSPTSIVATVAAGASGNVSVTTPGGTSSLPGFSYYNTPVINSFLPVSGKSGDTILISGNYFTGSSQVLFGSIPASWFSVINNTSIKAVVGPGTSGFITVVTPGGNAVKAGFVYSGPIIASFTPTAAGEDETVTIFGSNFIGITAVSFGGVPALEFTVVDSGKIQAKLAGGASGIVEVNAVNGKAIRVGFNFNSKPIIYAFTPTNGNYGSGITITGKYFSGVTSVMVGGIAASSFNVLNDSAIHAVIGLATQGSVTVTTPGGTASLAGFNYQVTTCIGGSASIRSNLTGNNYQWQLNNGTGFAPVINGTPYSGAQSAVLSISTITAAFAEYAFRCIVDGRPGTTFTIRVVNRWNGTQSNVWENPQNWACGSLPDSLHYVIISAGTVNINSDVKVKALQINSAANVRLLPGKKLQLSKSFIQQIDPGKIAFENSFYLLHTNIPSLLLKPGEQAGLKVKKFSNNKADSIPTGIQFSSSNAGVVSVSNSGFVQALGAGFCLITIADANGQKTLVPIEVRTTDVPDLLQPFSVSFAQPVFIENPDVATKIPYTVLNRIGIPILYQPTFYFSAEGNYQSLPASGFVQLPFGSYLVIAAAGGNQLAGNATLLSIGSVFTVPPSELPFTFHISLPFGRYPYLFTNIGLTSEPVRGLIYTLVTYKIMFGEFWTGFYGMTIMTHYDDVDVETESGAVVSGGGSTLTSVKPGTGRWRARYANFTGSWNRVQVLPDLAGEWCCDNDTYGHSAKMKIPKAPDVIFYGGAQAPNNLFSNYYKSFTGNRAPGFAQIEDGTAQFTDLVTAVTTPVYKCEIGPDVEAALGVGLFASPTYITRPLQTGDFFGGLLFNYYLRGGPIKYINKNEFLFYGKQPGDPEFGNFTPAVFKRCGFDFKPEIKSFGPTSGDSSTTVIVTGSGFANATDVTFGGVSAASFNVLNDSTISAVLSNIGASGPVRVFTPGGVAESINEFYYYYPPVKITSFSPTTAGPGDIVTIRGNSFQYITSVNFGNASARSFTIVDPATIKAEVNWYGASGAVKLYGPAGSDTLAGFSFVVPPCDTITRISADGNSYESTGDYWNGSQTGFQVKSRGRSNSNYCNYIVEDINGGTAGEPGLYLFMGVKPSKTGPLNIVSSPFSNMGEGEIWISRGNWKLVPGTGTAFATVENGKITIRVENVEMEWFITTYYKIKVSFTFVGL